MVSFIILCVALKAIAANKDNDSPNTGNSGRYTVKEEVQKAPEVNHFCNLTRTSVKITFPEMKSRVFVNFLGYKEPNLIHLQRCKGRCGDTDSSSCIPLRTKETKVKMMMKSYLTLPDRVPDERVREILLEEHLECGCACDETSPVLCLGKFNKTTCQCDCSYEEYGQAKSLCEEALEMFWNYDKCTCDKRSVVARGAGEEPRSSFSECGSYLASFARRGNSILDIGGWVLLGSCLALVAILAAATYHYRKKLRILQGKEKKKNNKRSSNNSGRAKSNGRKTFFHDRETSKFYKNSDRVDTMTKMPSLNQLDRIAIENSLLLSGTGGGQLYHEQYDEHGVKIEYQMFK